MSSDQGTDPGEVVNARVRCTCGAEINCAEMVCRNGHSQAWMRELPKMVACDDGSCEHRDCAEVRSTLRRRADLIGRFHPGPIADCTDPETCWWWQQSQLLQSVEGVGPDAPTETNEHGASQSKALYAFTSLDPHALFRVAATAAFGDAKYGVDNWRGISALDHTNHALTHIYAHLADDPSDDHLAHAACRMLMALAIDIQGGPRARS